MKRILLLFLTLLACYIPASIAQVGKISGRVLDEKGQGIPSAGITIKGTTIGTVTDFDGNFNLEVPADAKKLVVQAVSYNAQEVTPANGMTIRMQSSSTELKGTIVTALALKREKRDLGYSATTISSDDLNSGNNVSALSAIQGKTAGVNITSNTGGPGGSTRVVLRGEKSIGGNNNALIVVDGIPINNSSRLSGASSLEQVDFGNRGNDVNPEDIESISVLKGPAAAALYGSAGANGAIMITTKSGKSKKGPSKTEISYTTSYTLSDILKYPEFQNKFGQGDAQHNPNDRRENFSWGLPFDGKDRPWGQNINGAQRVKPYAAIPDNVRDFFNVGKTWENNVSLGGGGDKGGYFVSLNTLRNDAVVPNNYYNKYSLRFNGSTELKNNFYTAINVNYLNIGSRTEAQGQALGGVWDNLLQQPRDIPIAELADLNNPFNSYSTKDAAGNNRYGYYGAYTDNPYYLASFFENANKVDRFLGNVNIGYKKGNWNIFNRIGGDIISDRVTMKTPKYSATPWDAFYAGNNKTSAGGYFESSTASQNINNDLIANFSKALSDKISLNVLAGNSIQYFRSNFISGEINYRNNGLVVADFYNLSNGTGPVVSSNVTNESFTLGVYGDIRVDYNRKIFLEITARNDWASTLYLTNSRLQKTSFFYPSASLSYIFTEDWKNNVLTYGKLRASYASVGNGAPIYANNQPGYARTTIQGNFSPLITFPFNNIPGYSLAGTLATTDLRPERTNSYEVGTDLSFFKDRITVDFSYYYTKTIDQILALPVPSSTGFDAITKNVGDVTNQGIELAVKTVPLSTASGLRWELFGTYTRNKSEVNRLEGGVSQVVIGGSSDMSITATVGQPYGAFYAIDYERDSRGRTIIDTNTGLPRIATDKTYQGTFQPRFIASWGTSLKFKGLSVNVLFDTKQGGVFYSNTKRLMDFVGTAKETDFNDRQPYVMPNSVYQTASGNYAENTSYKTDPYLLNTTIYQRTSAVHIMDASYVKLREASITYALPEKLLKRTYIGQASVGIYGNNLFIWTAKQNKFVDPEVNAGGATNEQGFDFTARPSLRNYGIRLSITF
jgi:TonB-linked SusC/RagA family outer membrane protein